ncbi:MAG: type II toxin-antitoxin system RelE/ParE family toxin [Rubrivivax sp.]
MTRLVYADAFNDDIERIVRHLLAHDADHVEERLAAIIAALEMLIEHPLIGRPTAQDLRELVIGRGTRGYVARYRFDERADTVHVLALRAQREAGFSDD